MLVLKFQVLDIAYAIAVGRVVEVVPRVELRPLPHAPRHLVGLLHYRGGAVPVIDLGLLMGSQACRDRLDTRIILVHSGTSGGRTTSVFGLVAERVEDVEALDPSRQVAAGVCLVDAPYLSEVYETDHGLLQLVDPAEVPVSFTLALSSGSDHAAEVPSP